MMGPSLTLWLQEALGPEGRRDLIAWLGERGDVALIDSDFELSLQLADGEFGLSGTPKVSVLGLSLGASDIQSGDDYSQVAALPVQELAIGATELGRVNEIAVGKLALLLMRKLRALVDFDGIIGPTPWVSEGPSHEFEKHLNEVRTFLEKIPGTVREVRYMAHDGTSRYVHVADDVFLEAWLEHPAYHLLEEWQ